MIELMIFSIVLTLLIGLAAKLILDRIQKAEYIITWREFMLISGVCCFVITPIVTMVGWELAKKNKISYNEYQNGWESATRIEEIVCHKNGMCRHTYACDPYEVCSSCNCDEHGCSTCCHTVYDSCPYCTHEYTYVVNTTLGDYDIDIHRFPLNPQDHRWREYVTIPDSEIERVGVGEPQFWTEANNRIKSGKPGWMTKIGEYRNLIYASDSNILKQYSGAAQRYVAVGFMPRLNTSIRNYYLANKVYFVGLSISDSAVWNDRLGYLDATLGSGLQGDLHLVLVDAAKMVSPDEFVLALKAYWMDPAIYGKHALSKNAVVVVLGTDGKMVLWARGFTGMPVGNDGLITALASLKGQELNSEGILGTPAWFKNTGVEGAIHTPGSLGNIIFGVNDKATRFKRVHMESFGYLMNEIEPSTVGKVICLVINLVLSCVGWAIAIFGEIL